MQNDFHTLTVSGKNAQTEQASVIYLAIPPDLADAFAFEAGQYLTLRVTVDGQEERRAYSMCTAPHQAEFGFCVKRLAGGTVSNYLLDRLAVGDTLEVMAPEGRFLLRPQPESRRAVYLIGAGSGITPLLSIARAALEREPGSAVHLLYGNRDEDSIIFREELDAMARTYRGQFTVDHVLSRPSRTKSSGIAGLFGRSKPSWDGRIGRVDEQELKLFLAEREESGAKSAEYYICGPGAMIDTVEKELLREGVDAKHIHTERFVVAAVAEEDRIRGADFNRVRVTLDGKVHDLTIPAGKTILETLIAEGQNPPYSCTSGACSTCIAKVTAGEVKMDVNHALDPDEVTEGYVLTCQSHPVTQLVELTYDE